MISATGRNVAIVEVLRRQLDLSQRVHIPFKFREVAWVWLRQERLPMEQEQEEDESSPAQRFHNGTSCFLAWIFVIVEFHSRSQPTMNLYSRETIALSYSAASTDLIAAVGEYESFAHV